MIKPHPLPDTICLFPLSGALLLPRGRLPLHIFEPRYLAMIEDCLKTPERLIGTVQVRDACVASSGDYERCFLRNGRRYHHVLDPRTGMPSRGMRGVVTVSRQPDPVNGLGAAIMVAGAAAGQQLLAPLRGVDSLMVDASAKVLITGRMGERLQAA